MQKEGIAKGFPDAMNAVLKCSIVSNIDIGIDKIVLLIRYLQIRILAKSQIGAAHCVEILKENFEFEKDLN